MTHNEQRGHWLKEGAIGLSTGILFGMTSVAVGHPFDTVKTKMQAQSGFLEGGGTIQAMSKVWRAEGIRGLYRGWLPPMIGSGLYRSTQFAVYEALYTKWDANRDANGKLIPTSERTGNRNTVVPYTGGVETRVLAAGFCSAMSRAVIECPIEYAKVARQTGQSWELRKVYTGFGVQAFRTWGVMQTFFVCVDSTRRHFPSAFSTPAGQFLVSSCSATLGFWLVWPAEVIKNQVQAHTPIYAVDVLKRNGITGQQMMQAGTAAPAVAQAAAAPALHTVSSVAHSAASHFAHPANLPAPLPAPSILDRIRYLIYVQGVTGLYRGIGPGTARSMLANGVSMVVMVQANKKVTEWGWRN